MTRPLMDVDRQREQVRQSLILDRLDARYGPAFAFDIARASREMVKVYELTGEVGAGQEHYTDLQRRFESMAIDAALIFGGRVLDQAGEKGFLYTFGDGGFGAINGKSAPYFERKEDFAQRMTRLALLYVAQEAVRQKITSIAETTRARIIALVDQGYREGLGIEQVGRMIRDRIPAMSLVRGAMIARTETHGAAQFGADAAARETGLPLRKEWVAAEDERTREDHRAANGQIVGMDDAFSVGGVSMMYPGDPSAPVEQVANCRCVSAYIVSD